MMGNNVELEIERSFERADQAAEDLVRHSLMMRTNSLVVPLEVDGKRWRVKVFVEPATEDPKKRPSVSPG